MLIFKVNQDSLCDVILLASQGVSFTEVQEGLIVRKEVNTLSKPVALRKALNALLGFCPRYILGRGGNSAQGTVTNGPT